MLTPLTADPNPTLVAGHLTERYGQRATGENRPVDTPAIDPHRRLQSFYVPMSDGVRLAVDLWLPMTEIEDGHTAGTVLRATRYHRAAAVKDPTSETDSNAAEAAIFNDAGLALVVVDARGSGASFGSRLAELSAREIADYGEVIDWIAGQGWSNGRVGAYGYSYDGDAAELMASLRNPHLVAVAPLFSDFDPYRQLVYPGGCYTEAAFGAWLGFTRVLDGVAAIPAAAEAGSAVRGPLPSVKPVDGPDGPALLAQAIREHQANPDLAAAVARAECRDDREGGVDWDTPSPACRQAAIEASGVALFVRAGWLDAGTPAGVLTRFATFTKNPQQTEIGPWSHGGETHADPLQRPGVLTDELSIESQNDRLAEFFRRELRADRADEPSAARRELRLCTLGTGEWRTFAVWPPPGVRVERWSPAGDGRLATTPGPPATVSYAVDATASTGATNRWAGNVSGQPVAYADRRHADGTLLTWTSQPLADDLHILGFPALAIRLSTTETDGAICAYLEAVAPDGHVAYLSEGLLRLTQRATRPSPQTTSLGVPRTFRRADLLPVAPGKPMDLVLELLPISALIPAGHLFRLAIAGHDAGCLARYGHDEETLTVHLGHHFHLDVPVMPPTRAATTVR